MEVTTISESIFFLWIIPVVLFVCLPLLMLFVKLATNVLSVKSKEIHQESTCLADSMN